MNVIESFIAFTDEGSTSIFTQFHKKLFSGKLNEYRAFNLDLKCFLTATMDEVRLRRASSCIKNLLRLLDLDNIDYFRIGLLRREISGDISYPKQRDHSAHTLYNYVLGWYIFANSIDLRKYFKDHFVKRCMIEHNSAYDDITYYFGMIWPYTSILHDIGYIFEGSLLPLSTAIQSEQVKLGAEIVHDFFHHRFWISYRIDSTYDRNILKRLANVEEPDFSITSLSSVADSLRTVGSVEPIRRSILHMYDGKDEPEFLQHLQDRLPEDSFDLWELNYRSFNSDVMAGKIRYMRAYFEKLANEGFRDSGLRILDHGVCSGLLLLMYITYFSRIYFGLGIARPESSKEQQLWTQFKERPLKEGIYYKATFWWQATVWATAATALHNVQLSHADVHGLDECGPLDVGEDPLTYLGILVDCLQEWDRYNTSRQSVIGGDLPVQGIDVELGVQDFKVLMRYPSTRMHKVSSDLDGSLRHWQQFALFV